MSKKRWLLYIIFGLVFYLLFLIIELPASWVAWGLNRYTQGTVRLDPISGNLWGGNGRLVIYYPSTTPHDFGQTKWHINPLWLLTGRVKLSLQANHQDRHIKTTVELANEYFMLHDTEAELTAPFIAQIYTPLALINPQGKVRLIASELIMTPENFDGAAVLEWLNAGSSISSVQPLGDYRLDITGADKNANLKLTTLRGDLEFTGEGLWQLRSGQLNIRGLALPRARVGELESLLRMIGKDEGGGKRTLNISARLPPILSSN
jgi:general secretion pathway protein N